MRFHWYYWRAWMLYRADRRAYMHKQNWNPREGDKSLCRFLRRCCGGKSAENLSPSLDPPSLLHRRECIPGCSTPWNMKYGEGHRSCRDPARTFHACLSPNRSEFADPGHIFEKHTEACLYALLVALLTLTY